MINHNTYIIPLAGIDLTRILKTWTWLAGENKTVVALTKMGDALLKDNFNKLFFLNTGLGDLTEISGNCLDFVNGKLKSEVYHEILLPRIVDELEEREELKSNQVYCFIKLPLIGGTYSKENIYAGDLYEHYNVTGEIHLQLKDLPDGTEVDFKVVE